MHCARGARSPRLDSMAFQRGSIPVAHPQRAGTAVVGGTLPPGHAPQSTNQHKPQGRRVGLLGAAADRPRVDGLRMVHVDGLDRALGQELLQRGAGQRARDPEAVRQSGDRDELGLDNLVVELRGRGGDERRIEPSDGPAHGRLAKLLQMQESLHAEARSARPAQGEGANRGLPTAAPCAKAGARTFSYVALSKRTKLLTFSFSLPCRKHRGRAEVARCAESDGRRAEGTHAGAGEPPRRAQRARDTITGLSTPRSSPSTTSSSSPWTRWPRPGPWRPWTPGSSAAAGNATRRPFTTRPGATLSPDGPGALQRGQKGQAGRRGGKRARRRADDLS